MDLLTWLVGAFLATLCVGGAGYGLSPAAPSSTKLAPPSAKDVP